MKLINLGLILALAIIFMIDYGFAADGAAKVIMLRGEVFANKTSSLKKGDWIKEGTLLTSGEKSFVKLFFRDQSQITLGPSSEMKVDSFPEKESGIISLVKGQMRSKVSKNYRDKADKKKSKLFVKTRSAAMGVRGTDFAVEYSPRDDRTQLEVLSGEVVIGTLGASDSILSAQFLENTLNSPQSVMVTKGMQSGLISGGPPAAPQKIPEDKLERMKTDEMSSAQENSKSSKLSLPPSSSAPPPGMAAPKDEARGEGETSKVIAAGGLEVSGQGNTREQSARNTRGASTAQRGPASVNSETRSGANRPVDDFADAPNSDQLASELMNELNNNTALPQNSDRLDRGETTVDFNIR